ncbi:MAG: Ig-like domain-containing protein, partial [Thermoplasmata archaeon]
MKKLFTVWLSIIMVCTIFGGILLFSENVEAADAPIITSTSPADNETNVDLDQNITVYFNRTMDINSVNYTCVPDPGGWNVTWNATNNTATFSHYSFSINTTYTFEITDAKDEFGNDLIAGPVPNPWQFSTGNATAPAIISTSPYNGQNSVPINSNIVV